MVKEGLGGWSLGTVTGLHLQKITAGTGSHRPYPTRWVRPVRQTSAHWCRGEAAGLALPWPQQRTDCALSSTLLLPGEGAGVLPAGERWAGALGAQELPHRLLGPRPAPCS